MSYQYNAVRVEVRYARNLHDTEFFGKMDPYCVVQLGKGKKFKTKVQKDVGSNPTWNETTILQYGMEPEMTFKVMDKESIKDDDFVGSATVSMAAVASAGRWSGDLALYRSKDKPAGSLSVAITMLPETAAPMMSGGPPVVTATVMGGGPPPPAMMMPGMQQQQPVAATVISSGAPSAPYGGAAAYGATAPPPYQQQQPPAPYGYQAQQGYTPTGAVPMVAATAVGAYGAQQMYGHQQGVIPMYHEDDKKKKKKDKKDKKDKKHKKDKKDKKHKRGGYDSSSSGSSSD